MTGLYLSVKPISFRRFGASFGRGNSNYHTNLSAKNFADKLIYMIADDRTLKGATPSP